MSIQRSTARRPVAVPLSTKIASCIGVLLVVGGIVLAAWQKLTANDEPQNTIAVGGHALPGLHFLLPLATAIVVVVIAVSIAVLSSGKRPVR